MRDKTSTESKPFPQALKWFRPLLVLFACGFSLWFFYAVYAERNDGKRTERIGNSADDSKRLRTEVRTWFKKTFPESAARADERFGFFEFDGAGGEPSGDWVFLAHGLDEPGNLWANLAPALVDGGFRVFDFRYPNDQPIHESSAFFHRQLDDLLAATRSSEPAEKIHLIAHSMGGLVLRNYLTHPEFQKAASIEKPPIKNFIQLATPNHGSWLASYRLPVELRDHLFKNYGLDALLGMIWDGAGEAQIDLTPESKFLEQLNSRSFPESVYWVGMAGTGSPVDLNGFQTSSWAKKMKLTETVEDLNVSFPELFKGTGDGCVSIESLRCDGMDEVHYLDATHRSIVRDKRVAMPPSIPIVLEILSRI